MITLRNLTYRYRNNIDALNDVNADIPCGIHLLLGENGAGKTTMLHVIASLLRPTAGSCLIDGESTSQRSPQLLEKLFILSDDMIFPGRTINGFKKIHSVFYPNFSEEMLQANLQEFGMTGDEPLDKLSLGTRKKAQIAYALALRTEVLLFDEPANGLDITTKKALRYMMARCIDETQTAIISTHTVWDFQNLFDGLLVLSRGQLILAASTAEVSERIAFVDSQIPPYEAIYMEQELGQFRSMVENTEGLTTDINYTLLYSALQSDRRQDIINLINRQ